MTIPDPAALRDGVLAVCRDRAARAAVESGRLRCEEHGRPWESSDRVVQGVAVTLGVGPAALGALSNAFTREALQEAVAVAVSRFDGISLLKFACRWEFGDDPASIEGGALAAPYRGEGFARERPSAQPEDEELLRRAVIAYVTARGEASELPAYEWRVRAELPSNTPGLWPEFPIERVVLSVPRDVARAKAKHPELTIVTEALRDLCGAADSRVEALRG